jgi:phosphoribosylformylglycinamidine (FGAM) synthase PurS component
LASLAGIGALANSNTDISKLNAGKYTNFKIENDKNLTRLRNQILVNSKA